MTTTTATAATRAAPSPRRVLCSRRVIPRLSGRRSTRSVAPPADHHGQKHQDDADDEERQGRRDGPLVFVVITGVEDLEYDLGDEAEHADSACDERASNLLRDAPSDQHNRRKDSEEQPESQLV